jgi:sec-independent protein translocase protein TatB
VDILGIGPMELLLILIVMLMVFGPDKLPQIGAKLGRTMRDMRKATRAISSEINATRDAITAEAKPITDPLEEVADAAKSAGSLVAAAKNPGQALRDSVMKELKTPAAGETEATSEPENTIAPPTAVAVGEGTVITAAPVESAPSPEPEALASDAGPTGSLIEQEASQPPATPDADASRDLPAEDDPHPLPPAAAGAEPAAGEQ